MTDDELRAALTEAAEAWDKRTSASESWMPGLIDALLPVVRAHTADVLVEAADLGGHTHWVSSHDLYARADALRARS